MNPRAMIQTMISLASASLGLVAALAWNEAIKALLAELHLGDNLAGLFAYALVATLVAVVVLRLAGQNRLAHWRRSRFRARSRGLISGRSSPLCRNGLNSSTIPKENICGSGGFRRRRLWMADLFGIADI